MTKVKIISNPYQKKTLFQHWDNDEQCWLDVNAVDNGNSKLLKQSLTEGFFPFKAREIVDVLIEEYKSDGEKVEIEFEGTNDEYQELLSIVSSEKYVDSVEATASALYLENARDILPKIIDVFKKVKSLTPESVRENEDIKSQLEKFSDASNDIIPICVIGNYSSGKSTFINSLIGYELLPSSDEPTTAKIYKISQSPAQEKAKVVFKCDVDEIEIRITNDSVKLNCDPDSNELTQLVYDQLTRMMNEIIPVKLNKTLEIINSYANKHSEEISDLIEVSAPFDEDGIWDQIPNKFVLFDTPGSNSASNVKHYEVLKKAMQGLSNGLPVFVSVFDNLDSTDNDKLYQDINNLESLDKRFTMIVVNKADIASLKKGGYDEGDVEKIMSFAIPRNLYSSGVFFVSSVMGLGAKNDEGFIYDHNAEVFEDQKNKYKDKESRFYKTLYKYNIQPKQIYEDYEKQCESHENLVYANSGLYSVEQAIKTFSMVYSHYNKCEQSKYFLNQIINKTRDQIEINKKNAEDIKATIYASLERGKAELLEKIDGEGKDMSDRFHDEYPGNMEFIVKDSKSKITPWELDSYEKQMLGEKYEAENVEDHRKDILSTFNQLTDSMKENASNVLKERNMDSLKKMGKDFADQGRSMVGEISEYMDSRNTATTEASEELLVYVKERYNTEWKEAFEKIGKKSVEYWENRTKEFKTALIEVVSDSTALSEEQSDKLKDIIIKYEDLVLNVVSDKVFDNNPFVIQLFSDVKRLAKAKIIRTYNSSMEKTVDSIYESLKQSQGDSFTSWANSLVGVIRENVVELNPKLLDQANIIKTQEKEIDDLQKRLTKLNNYQSKIEEMLEWKEKN